MINFNYRKENQVGILEITGKKYFKDGKEGWNKVRQYLENDKLNCILIFDKSENYISTDEVIMLEKYLHQINFPQNKKVAIIDEQLTDQMNINVYGENIARHHGWKNIAVFANEKAARQWISRPL